MVEYDIQPFVSCIEYAKAVEKAAEKADKKVKVHLKVDSGMSRAGCRWEDALPLARYIEASPYLELAGACTHFAVSDTLDEVDVADTRKQIDKICADDPLGIFLQEEKLAVRKRAGKK